MRTVCVVQARTGSTRLPGKVLLEVKGKPLLVHTLDRLKRCERIDHLILATSNLPQDRVLLNLAKKEGVEGFAGSEENVLDRYYRAVVHHRPETVVRCTGDCPLLDSEVTDLVIRRHDEKQKDYTSNTLVRSYPRGLDTEVMKFSVLEKAARESTKDYEWEHVTPYLYRHPELFTIEQVVAEKERTIPGLRLCVDTVEDFELIREIFGRLYDQNSFFSVDDILALVRSNPELMEINAHVQQKQI